MNIDLTAANIRLLRIALPTAAAILATLGTNFSSGAAELTASQLTALVRDPALHISAKKATVLGQGPVVTVLAEEDPKTADRNLKIDAMFLSKALIEAAPGQISTVRIVFSKQGLSEGGRYISIENKAIQDFGSGKLTPEKLLASLQFSMVEGEERMPDVSPQGPELPRRVLLWRRIDKLKSQGTGVGPFESIFHEIEAQAKANDPKVTERIEFLEAKLTGQEEQVRDAKKAQLGRGVPASTIVHQPAVSGPANKFEAPMMNSPPVPPDAENIKRHFMEKAQEFISEIEPRDHTSATNLRVLKQDIDKKFAAHQDGAAFSEIATFAQAVTKVLGVPFGGQGPGGGPPGGGPQGGGPPGFGPNGGPPPP